MTTGANYKGFGLVKNVTPVLSFTEMVRKRGEDVCFLQTFKKTCPVGQAVHVLSAKTRDVWRRATACPPATISACYDDVSEEMREKCYGRETCEIFVSSLGNLVSKLPEHAHAVPAHLSRVQNRFVIYISSILLKKNSHKK